MSRAVLAGLALALSAAACTQPQSADRPTGRASDQGIEQCSVEATDASLDLSSLSDDSAKANGTEVRVWLLEPGNTHYFLRLITDDGQVAGQIRPLTFSYSKSGTADRGSGAAWCELVGSYIAYQALAPEDTPRDWSELLDKAEAVLQQQTTPVRSSSYDSPVVVVEARNATGYRKAVIAELESDRPEIVRAARELRNKVLDAE